MLTKDKILQLSQTTVEAIAAAGALHQVRERSRAETAAAIRRIESALGQVLTGAQLTAFVGLPNLGTGGIFLRGLNVRARNHHDKLRRPSWGASDAEGSAMLVLDARGQLRMALLVRGSGDLGLSLRGAEDADFLPEDLELVAEAAIDLLTIHREGAGDRAQTLERATQLAHHLEAALAAWDRGSPTA